MPLEAVAVLRRLEEEEAALRRRRGWRLVGAAAQQGGGFGARTRTPGGDAALPRRRRAAALARWRSRAAAASQLGRAGQPGVCHAASRVRLTPVRGHESLSQRSESLMCWELLRGVWSTVRNY